MINLLEEEVDGNVNHSMSAQFNFPPFPSALSAAPSPPADWFASGHS